MKKWALPLSLAVVLAANSAAALAATDPIATNFRGEFKTQLQYNSKDVNKDADLSEPGDRQWVTGAFGAVNVDLRGDIVLSPNAQNRFVLELRGRVRGDKYLDAFPTRIDVNVGHPGRFGPGLSSGNIFGKDWNTSEWIDKAYLENKSAWWTDGPEITTRIGRQDPNYNPWVGRIWKFDRTGVTVEGFKLGPVEIRAGYIWGGENQQLMQTRIVPDPKGRTTLEMARANNVQSLIVNAAIPVESAKLDLTAVRTTGSGPALDKAVLDYAVGLTVPLTEQLSLDGNYARDGYNEKNAYRVQLGAKVGAANLTALYRAVDEGFAPIYEDRDDFMNPDMRTESKVHDERTGFKIAADTQVHNWKLSGSFDSSYRQWLGRSKDEKIDTIEVGASTRFSTVDFSAGVKIEKSKEGDYAVGVQEADGRIYRVGRKNDKNVYTVGLGTNFDIVRATYEFKHTHEKKFDGSDKKKHTDHTIALAAPLKVAYLDTLHVGGSVTLRDAGRKTGYGIDLAWQGKNGLRFGVHYTDGYKVVRDNGYYDKNGNIVPESRNLDPEELRKYVYPDGTTHYLGNGLAVTAGWGIEF